MKKRLLAILTAAVLLWTVAGTALAQAGTGTAGLTREDLSKLNGGTVEIHEKDGKISFVGGTCTADPVKGQEDAERVVASMVTLLGGDESTGFEPRCVLNDPAGNIYYVFQQVLNGTLVMGGAVKVITDRDGKMLGLTGSVISDLPETETPGNTGSLTAEQAEALVLKHEMETGNGEPSLAEGHTRKVILPVDREPDLEADEIRSRYVWSVYTTNPSVGANGPELPYLAHYVTLSGEYLYSLPTIVPGDGAGEAGYDASYIFEFMEPVGYTGYVDLSDGTEKEISVTLMRDTRTGMYYLGNIEHRIVVADCWEFLYNHGRVVLEYSPDNREWDQTGLLSLYNYCKALDYFKDIGWNGSDGKGTPMIILRNFCDEDHHPINNAAYAGTFYGWQVFLSSSINDLSQCLDVCAHEFTHCVSEAATTYNAYMNDYGAINEAISDIHGNLCEMLAGASDDTSWTLGENSTTPVRSMSDPNRYGQPAYVWDVYYHAGVKDPTETNDHGGVHSNSSLLSHVAWLLCSEGGMTLEDARSYWFAVDCAMVPGSDYSQLKQLLPWVMKITGLGIYQEALAKAMETTRLGDDRLPESVDADKALLTLNLPDNEVFNNGKWLLKVTCINFDKLKEKILTLVARTAIGDLEGYPKIIRELAEMNRSVPEQEHAKEEKSLLELLLDALAEGGTEETEPAANEPAETENDLKELFHWIGNELRDVLYDDMGSAGADGHVIRMMSKPGRALPVLMYISMDPGEAGIEKIKYLCQLNGIWYDLTALLPEFEKGEEASEENTVKVLEKLMQSELLKEAVRTIRNSRNPEDLLNAVTMEIKGGHSYELSAAGLEGIDLNSGITNVTLDEGAEVNNRMSRPKEN